MTQPQCPIESAQRISVVGSTGSGKTYLARELSQRLGLPHHELDHLRRPELTSTDGRVDPGFVASVKRLVERPSWVIDGHYREVRYLVWARSDLVIHLNYSPVLIVWRLLSRSLGNSLGRRRCAQSDARFLPGHQSGKPISAGWKRRFARLFKTLRERPEYARIFARREFRDLTVVELTSPGAARRWLEQLVDRASDGGSVRIV